MQPSEIIPGMLIRIPLTLSFSAEVKSVFPLRQQNPRRWNRLPSCPAITSSSIAAQSATSPAQRPHLIKRRAHRQPVRNGKQLRRWASFPPRRRNRPAGGWILRVSLPRAAQAFSCRLPQLRNRLRSLRHITPGSTDSGHSEGGGFPLWIPWRIHPCWFSQDNSPCPLQPHHSFCAVGRGQNWKGCGMPGCFNILCADVILDCYRHACQRPASSRHQLLPAPVPPASGHVPYPG